MYFVQVHPPPHPLLHLVCGLITGVLQSQVNHGVLQSAAHVKLQGEVVDTLQENKEYDNTKCMRLRNISILKHLQHYCFIYNVTG